MLWDVFERYHELKIGKLGTDPEMDPVVKARLMTIINEELTWKHVGLAITLGLCQLHGMRSESGG